MGDAQRTKTSTWPVSDDPDDRTRKVESLAIVFNFIETTYHRFFQDSAEYSSDYKAPSNEELLNALLLLEARLFLEAA